MENKTLILDTTKLAITISDLDFKEELFIPNVRFSKDFDISKELKITKDGIFLNNRAVKQTFRLKDNPIGITYVNVDVNEGNAEVLFSAKILKEQYCAGIHQNTVGRLHSELKRQFFPNLKEEEVLEATVCRADIAINMNLKSAERKKTGLEAIQLLKYNTNYQITNYGYGGITLEKDVSSYKHYFNLYNKFDELEANKGDGGILSYLSAKDIAALEKVIRCELQITDFKHLREATDPKKTKGGVKLSELLVSKEPVLYKQFAEACKYIPPLEKIENIASTLFGDDAVVYRNNLMYKDLYENCLDTKMAVVRLNQLFGGGTFYNHKKAFLQFSTTQELKKDIAKAPEHLKILQELQEMVKPL